MPSTNNKVKFGLKNCHYAKATLDPDTNAVIFGTPVAIPGAVNLPLSGIQNMSASAGVQSVFEGSAVSKDTVMFIYCLRGSRSMRAAGILKKMGYQNVKSIGGIKQYQGEIEK